MQGYISPKAIAGTFSSYSISLRDGEKKRIFQLKYRKKIVLSKRHVTHNIFIL